VGADQGHDVAASTILSPRTQPERLAAAVFSTLEHGVDLDRLSLADAGGQISTGDERFVEGGLGALIARLGSSLPVRLNTAVQGIDWSGPGVRVLTGAGPVTARAVIVTIPVGLLAQGVVRFIPELPAALGEAFAALPMGLLNKGAVMLRSGAVPDGTHLTHARGDGSVGSVVVQDGFAVSFAGGSFARQLEAAGPAAAQDFHRAVVRDGFGADALVPAAPVTLTAWGQDPWARGAYSAARPGHAEARTKAGGLIGGRIAFAGEAWDTQWATQAGGAWITGERAARLVARVL
jgi:monoamine oxidase